MYPSVTQVLKPFSDFSAVRPEVLENAANRGSRVHAACAAIMRGLWPLVQEDIKGYVASFRQWIDTAKPKLIASEIELVDHNFRYCGHPDLICKIGKDIVVIDLKTPATPSPSWRIQCAAYHHLAKLHLNQPPDRTATLRLSAEGKAPIFDEWTAFTATDFAVFLNCLSAYRYFFGGK